ncbi:hypothetical protein [Chryseobacterium indoltheticum]|uniref:Uncharacterized protein n=1 Tax=Chryseobacterium indoltheticum TaxID=254 RepID=A0A381FH55_9FLAO|nr:hypothetical protein [Chryseobacterium indoltheticum]SUX45867.1 Uncharacterised protein [Chryseobacterium indoltheticum]
MTEENLTEYRYQLFKLKFTPINGINKNSKDIVVDILTYIMNKLLHERQGHLIDRYEGQRNKRRELFMNRAVFMAREQRVRCSLALLRSGKVPLMKPKESFTLVPISESLNGSIAEETHFFIDYSKNSVILCCEYNHHGPRMSDIQYYFRNIAHKVLRETKATEVSAFLERPIEETLEKLKNVLNINIKIDPRDFDKLTPDVQNKYFSGMKTMGRVLNPRFIRLEAYFQSPGGSVRSEALNTNANLMMKDLLRRMQGNQIDLDAFNHFEFEYEDKDGIEEKFNLLSGKKEIFLEVDPKNITSSRQWYELVKPELDNFITNL